MVVYAYSQTFWHPGVECKYRRVILLAEASCTWQCVIVIGVVILSLSCICAVVIFSVEAAVPLCDGFYCQHSV